MSNIRLRASRVAGDGSLAAAFLIYTLKIRNGLNSLKTNDKKFSNLYVFLVISVLDAKSFHHRLCVSVPLQRRPERTVARQSLPEVCCETGASPRTRRATLRGRLQDV